MRKITEEEKDKRRTEKEKSKRHLELCYVLNAIFAVLFCSALISVLVLTVGDDILTSQGEFILSCDSVEPGMINCQYQSNRLLPWLKPTIITYNAVTSASYETGKDTDGDGKQHTTYYALLSAHGEPKKICVFTSYDKTPVVNMINSINDVLQSKKEYYMIKKTTQELWSFETILTLSIFTLITIFIILGLIKNVLFLFGRFRAVILSRKTDVS